ncbi:MAG: peptidylprolyl isomerase [bacterium]|nr:peptidylprolyl isomerase [bacterium]
MTYIFNWNPVPKITALVISILCAIFALTACEPKPFEEVEGEVQVFTAERVTDLLSAPPETVLIAFKGTKVTKMELRDVFDRLYNRPKQDDTRELASRAVTRTVLYRNYLYLDAVKESMEVSPDIRSAWEAKIPLWTGKYYSKKLDADVNIDDAVARATVPSTGFVMTIRQIVLLELGEAQRIRERAAAGEDFAKLATDHSVGPASENGGLLTEPIITGLPHHYGAEIISRLEFLEKGEVSTVIPTGLGYNIFFMEDKRPLLPEEIDNMVEGAKNRLLALAVDSLKGKIPEKYPLKPVEGSLEKALETGDGSIVLGTVGQYEITWDWMQKVVLTLWPKGQEAVASTSVNTWWSRIREVAPDLAMREEAASQGVLEEKEYKENLDRAWKDALVQTALDRMNKKSEPSDEEIFSFYIHSSGQADSPEAIFSVRGVRGLATRDVAEDVAKDLKRELPLEGLVKSSDSKGGPEVLEGTYREGDFSEKAILTLEMTPVGDVTKPLDEKTGWAVYKVLGKKRGDLQPFEKAYAQVKNSIQQDSLKRTNMAIMERGAREYPADYLVEAGLVGEMIEEWLDARKTIRGISPSKGSFH